MGERDIKFDIHLNSQDDAAQVIAVLPNGTRRAIGEHGYNRAAVVHWLEKSGLDDLIALLSDAQPKADAGEGLTADRRKALDKFADQLIEMESRDRWVMIGDSETCVDLREMVAERRAAKARAAEAAAKLAEPEEKQTLQDLCNDARDHLKAGETVVVPERFPGRTWAETRLVARVVRGWWINDGLAGRLHDPHAHKPDPDTLTPPIVADAATGSEDDIPDSAPADPAPGQAEAFGARMAGVACTGPRTIGESIVAQWKEAAESQKRIIAAHLAPSTPDRDPSTGIADAMRATHTGATLDLNRQPRQGVGR